MKIRLAALAAALILAQGATARADDAYKTAKLDLLCGYADEVYDYIARTMGEKSSLTQPLDGRQGETFRNFLLYSDTSWVLTFEYFSPSGPAADDESCIVARGDSSTAYDGMDTVVTELPAKILGTPRPGWFTPALNPGLRSGE